MKIKLRVKFKKDSNYLNGKSLEESLKIPFKEDNFLDVLNIIKEGKVKFFFSKDTAPTILETPSIQNSLFLIMQMRA